jgi:hypothetical protein
MQVLNEQHRICVQETRSGILMLESGSYQKAVHHFMVALNTFNRVVNEPDEFEDSVHCVWQQDFQPDIQSVIGSSIVSIKSLEMDAFQIGLIDDYEVVSVMLIFNLALGYLCLSETLSCKLGSSLLKQKSMKLLCLSHDSLQANIENKLSFNDSVEAESQWMVTVLSMLLRLGRSNRTSIDFGSLAVMESRLAILHFCNGKQILEACPAA